MTLITFSDNKTLKGHKLLYLTQFPPSEGFLERARKNYPDLEIVYHQATWSQVSAGLPDNAWKDVTILLSFTLPRKELVPKLQYVQLPSAGANAILGNPLFKDTEAAFCTANGVHG